MSLDGRFMLQFHYFFTRFFRQADEKADGVIKANSCRGADASAKVLLGRRRGVSKSRFIMN